MISRRCRLSLLLTVIPFSACSLVGPRYQMISVASDPGGATVSVDGAEVGEAPLEFRVRRNDKIRIRIDKQGYHAQYRQPDHKILSALGGMDYLGGWLLILPFFGLLSDAAWSHEPADFDVRLQAVEAREAN